MADIRIEPWAEGNLWLLLAKNTPEMTAHLGGPEPEEKLAERHRRYLEMGGAGGDGTMFSVVRLSDGETVGTVGFWKRDWQGETVYEAGWGILTPHQGQGLAVVAVAAVVEAARAEGRYRSVHAYPSVHNAASNAVARRAGFALLGEVEFEYPKGSFKPCNDWCLELRGPSAAG
ncbi:GNAT family N-acetyltransferase [Kitasatospora sp. McL0602]|uniref:GNAT family N-acetyltransferase n=1 Tax=Kitasatospora sp. McL0602 TaxID=3439530 RepID=UPI003F8C653F